jgi:hypothetical protein
MVWDSLPELWVSRLYYHIGGTTRKRFYIRNIQDWMIYFFHKRTMRYVSKDQLVKLWTDSQSKGLQSVFGLPHIRNVFHHRADI